MFCLRALELRSVEWRRGARCIGALVLGAVPVVLLVIALKSGLALSNDIVSSSNSGIVGKLMDASRYIEISAWGIEAIFRHGGGGFVAFALALLMIGLRPWRELVDESLPLLAFIGMGIGYFGIYVITPHDLSWHLESSQMRLLTQLWPLALLAGCLCVRDPEIAFSRSTPNEESPRKHEKAGAS